MIAFMLNDCLQQSEHPAGRTLLDYIRYDQALTGTKTGCREGDCGACLVLEGRLIKGQLRYRSIVSCLSPLANVHGSHIVTIEGIRMAGLSPVQEAIVSFGATQCGFCTPGFVMAFTGMMLSAAELDESAALASMDGNLCRCTGYQSLRSAALQLADRLPARAEDRPISWLVQQGYLPAYFEGVVPVLRGIRPLRRNIRVGRPIVSGGTDSYVQQPDELEAAAATFLVGRKSLEEIRFREGVCTIGAGVTATDIAGHETLQQYFPGIRAIFSRIASTPIRNMGTLGGNIANASPIADLVIFFMALDASLVLRAVSGSRRVVRLADFFLGYKVMDKTSEEYIASLTFRLPGAAEQFNFEKVSKRTHLDIASVNTAMLLGLEDNIIRRVHISMGGVGPVPMHLPETARALLGQPIQQATVMAAEAVMQREISPISDIRGTASYKRLLARQLFLAHFVEMARLDLPGQVF
jgi:xanthine dehydrogenase small subunit